AACRASAAGIGGMPSARRFAFGAISCACTLAAAHRAIETPSIRFMRPPRSPQAFLAESEGFEPPSPCGLTDFKSAAFDRSANSPGLEKSVVRPHFSRKAVKPRGAWVVVG